MQVTNNTTNDYQLGQYYTLGASVSGFVIADTDYAGNTALKAEVDALLAAGSITVTSPPAGFAVVGNQLKATPLSPDEKFASATATAAVATATIAAVAGARLSPDRVELSFSATPTAPVLATLKDGASGTVLWEEEITAAGVVASDLSAEKLRGSVNTALVLVLPSGGTGIVGVVNVYAHVVS